MAVSLDNSVSRSYIAPMNVEQIAKRAQEYDYNPLIPLRYWLRTARSLIKEATIYEAEGNDEQAYLLLFRHAQLVLVNLASHPDAREPNNKRALAEAEREVKLNLEKLEELKPRINKKYDRFIQLVQGKDTKRVAPSDLKRNDTLSLQSPYLDAALAGTAQPLEAQDNKELAVQLAQREFSRRATLRKATRQAGISEDEEQKRRTAGVWGDWEEALRQDSVDDGSVFDRKLQEVGSILDNQGRGREQGQRSTSNYKYPAVPQKTTYEVYQSPKGPEFSFPKPPQAAPQPRIPNLPPKEPLAGLDLFPTPPVPLKTLPSSSSPPPPVPAKTSEPAVNDLRPSTFTFKPSAYLENGSPLRTIFLPPDLRAKFLRIAQPNTSANLETCGILCGTVISNALFVSRLVIPDQTATSDMCETINEGDIFDYCDKEDLLVLGWIHTHPSQTCFMSSRDLHTHGGYQVMLPESIAIVCAPSQNPDWGVFRLTDPPGLKHILQCQKPGIFHLHDDSPVGENGLYKDALRPGHVFEAKGLEFEVADLRPKDKR